MPTNRGKQFEDSFKHNWQECFPDGFLLRLYDTTNGFSNINNPCDFVCFEENQLFLIECKSHDGASIPFDAMPQYHRLLQYKNIKGVHAGILVWFKQKDKLIWVPIEEAEKLYNAKEKSIGLRHLETYALLDFAVKKKRVLLSCDYHQLLDFYKK